MKYKKGLTRNVVLLKEISTLCKLREIMGAFIRSASSIYTNI